MQSVGDLGAREFAAYVWLLPSPLAIRDPRPGEAAYEYSRTGVAIIRGGLPIAFRSRLSGVICFETLKGEASPLQLLKAVGYEPPRRLVERKFDNERCPAAVLREYGVHLPEQLDGR